MNDYMKRARESTDPAVQKAYAQLMALIPADVDDATREEVMRQFAEQLRATMKELTDGSNRDQRHQG